MLRHQWGMISNTPSKCRNFFWLRKICTSKDLTLFLTEHVMEVIMPISKRVIVLDGGQKIAEGEPQDIADNERVIQAYLGVKYAKSRKH